MRLLTVELEKPVLAALQRAGMIAEQQPLTTSTEIGDWLLSELYDAAVISMKGNRFGPLFCREIRSRRIIFPVIAIAPLPEDRTWSDYRSSFLEQGGDDILRQPINPRELVATVHAVTRRFRHSLYDIFEAELDGIRLKINLSTRTVQLNELDVALTDSERALVTILATYPGRALSKDVLSAKMYANGIDDAPELKILDVFVCKVRTKFDELYKGAGNFIETVWGQGYRMTPGKQTKRSVA